MPMTGQESWKSFQRSKTLYDKFGRAESSNIYIAQPGHHMLGCLNGIDPDSCELTINLIDPDELRFDVYQMLDGEYTAYYDYVDILMEIYVDGLGWFFINESPELCHDGTKEYKSVVAQGYEITLQQYDLEVFHVGTADANDRAFLATDNMYTDKQSDVNLNRGTVKFWRDTSEHKNLLDEINEETEYSQLTSILYKYPNVVANDWRISFYTDSTLRAAFVTMKTNAPEAEKSYWQGWIDAYDNTPKGLSDTLIRPILPKYPDLINHLTIKYTKGKLIKQTDDDGVVRYVVSTDIDKQYTAYELIQTELKRMKELSLLDLILRDVPEWEVGYVDTYIEPSSYTVSWTVTETPTLENYPASTFGNDPESYVGEIAYDTGRGYYYEFAETVEEDFYWRRLPKPDDTFSSLLQNQGGRFEIENQDVYSVLMQEIAPYYKCVFQFDTKNKLVNVYYLPSLGEDTRIFIGLRNVQNEVTISPSQDLYTQFTVENSEGFGIEQVNFGQREIEDISYFLNTKYLPQDLINKYKIYLAYRDTKRNEYVQLSRDYNKKLEEITKVRTRVPSGMYNTDQYETFSDDELQQELENYQALINGIEDMFRDHTDTLDENALRASVYWNDYTMIKTFTIPNINIEISNRLKYSYEPKTDFIDDYELDFDTYGYLYGRDELQNYKKVLEEKVSVYNDYKRTWNQIKAATDQATKDFVGKYTQTTYNEKHNLYVKYKNALDSCVAELNIRIAEYEDLKEELQDIDLERQRIAQSVTLENYSFENGYLIWKNEEDKLLQDEQPYYLGDPMPVSAFSDEEIARLSLFFRHTDYSNDNINYYSNVDTIDEQLIDEQLQMYDAAVDELYAESHPQYSYDTDIDSLLANNEWEDFVRYWENLEDDYHYIFQVGNFIRLGIGEEVSSFQVKLRLTSISFNPMTRDMDMSLEFSNMINYKARRNDFATLLNNAIGSAKNQIQAAYQRNSRDENNFEVSYDLIRSILQSGGFSSYTNNLRGNVSAGAINSIAGNFDSLVANYMSTNVLTAKLADVDELDADSAFIRYLETNLIVSSEIKVDELKAKLAQIDNLSTDSAFIRFLEANLVVAAEIDTEQLKAAIADIDDLTVQSAIHAENADVSTRSISADSATFATTATTALTAGSVKAENIDTSTVTASSGFMQYLEANAVVASAVSAQSATFATTATTALTANSIKAENIDTTTITAQAAFAQYLQSQASTAAQATITDAYIYNAVAGKISVADLAVGDIVLSNQMRILSENTGTEGMVMSGSEIQFLDSNGEPSISIGYNTTSDGQGGTVVDYSSPAIIIKDSNGSVMLNSSGLSQGDVGLSSMIQTSSISKNQLNFPIVDTDANGNISITNIKDGSGGNFGVEYTNFKNGTQSAIDNIEAQKMYRVVIESTGGNVFKNDDVSTTLSCKVYSWDDDITSTINASNFIWTRSSSDSASDTIWNQNHSTGQKTLTITSTDLVDKAVFYCNVNLPES